MAARRVWCAKNGTPRGPVEVAETPPFPHRIRPRIPTVHTPFPRNDLKCAILAQFGVPGIPESRREWRGFVGTLFEYIWLDDHGWQRRHKAKELKAFSIQELHGLNGLHGLHEADGRREGRWLRGLEGVGQGLEAAPVNDNCSRSEERRVGKECRPRW